MYRIGFHCVLVCGLSLAAPAAVRADGARPSIARHLHVVFLADTHADKIGSGVRVGYDRLVRVFGEMRAGREDRISWAAIRDEKLTPSAVLTYLRSLQFSNPTAILVFYGGHGGMSDRGHFFAMKYGSLYREEVRRAMEGTGAVLQVLVSDCCSNYADVAPPNRIAPRSTERYAAAGKREVFDQLFFQCRGMVDITAAEPGTFSWIHPSLGGFFTNVFADMLGDPRAVTDADGNGVVTWSEFFQRLRTEANAFFLRARDAASGPYKEDDIREYADQLAAYFYMNDLNRWQAVLRSGTAKLQNLRQTTDAIAAMGKKHQDALGRLNSRTQATAMAGFLRIEADGFQKTIVHVRAVQEEAKLAAVIAKSQENGAAQAAATRLTRDAEILTSSLGEARRICLFYASRFDAAAHR